MDSLRVIKFVRLTCWPLSSLRGRSVVELLIAAFIPHCIFLSLCLSVFLPCWQIHVFISALFSSSTVYSAYPGACVPTCGLGWTLGRYFLLFLQHGAVINALLCALLQPPRLLKVAYCTHCICILNCWVNKVKWDKERCSPACLPLVHWMNVNSFMQGQAYIHREAEKKQPIFFCVHLF